MATEKNPSKDQAKEAVKAPPTKGLKIASIQEGGRHRAGRFWPQEATTVLVSEFKPHELEALREDKKLLVVDVDLSDAEAEVPATAEKAE